eukprot:15598417-Heterocapsa_arctica.AAC.1
MADVAVVVRRGELIELGKVETCFELQLGDVTFKFEVAKIAGCRVYLSLALCQGVPNNGSASRALSKAQDAAAVLRADTGAVAAAPPL